MTRSWFPDGWTDPVIGTEDQMRMGVTPRDADFGYDGDLSPEQVEAWTVNSPESVIGNPAARLDPADVGHTDDWREELP